MESSTTVRSVDQRGLRDLRVGCGFTLRGAEYRLGLSSGELSRYENAKRQLPARIVQPMADLYKVAAEVVLAANERDWLRREETTPPPRPVPAAPRSR